MKADQYVELTVYSMKVAAISEWKPVDEEKLLGLRTEAIAKVNTIDCHKKHVRAFLYSLRCAV